MEEQQRPNDAPALDPKQKDELILHLRILEDLINSMLRLRMLAITVVVLVLILGAGFVGTAIQFHRTTNELRSDFESLRVQTREVKDSLDPLADAQATLRNDVMRTFSFGNSCNQEILRLHGLIDQIKSDAAERELLRFQGKWQPVKLIDAAGKPYADLMTYKLSVAGDQSLFENAKEKSDGTYRLQPFRRPREIDIIVTTGPDKDKTYLGVYEIVGDTLRIVHDPTGEKRPNKVEQTEGFVFEEWKRAK